MAIEKPVKAKAHRLRASISGRPAAIDRSARVLRGYVVAQKGPFKSQGRGEFDDQSLALIMKLASASPNGLKSRLGHPTMSDDGIGKFLGRSRDFMMGTAIDARTGKNVPAVRADLHFDPTAHDTPHGDLASYVMNLAESDADAISSSLVLETLQEPQLDAKGKQRMGPDGEPLPDIWRPTKIHASDIVDTGDAVDSLLSAQELAQALDIGLTPDLAKLLRFDNVARLSAQLLDGMFKNASRKDVRKACQGWLKRYLTERFGEKKKRVKAPTPNLDARRDRLEALRKMVSK